jgi:hypothetical protein
MQNKFNKAWFLVSLVIIANILIFSFLSKKLESLVINDMFERTRVENSFNERLPNP